jgi:hypothetical protein
MTDTRNSVDENIEEMIATYLNVLKRCENYGISDREGAVNTLFNSVMSFRLHNSFMMNENEKFKIATSQLSEISQQMLESNE